MKLLVGLGDTCKENSLIDFDLDALNGDKHDLHGPHNLHELYGPILIASA